jgi:hypothetical protein
MLVMHLLGRETAEQRIARCVRGGCAVTMTHRWTTSEVRRREKQETNTANDGTRTYSVITYAPHSHRFLNVLQVRVDEM